MASGPRRRWSLPSSRLAPPRLARAREAHETARALSLQAGTIISAAGIVMFFAFGALLVSPTPVLNQVGFMLCVGVLIDCFVTTKITIPTLMALVPGNANFWPRAQREEPSSSGARAAQSPPRQTLRKSLSWTAPRSVRSVRSDPNSPSNGGSGTSKREREVGGSS